jgi:hypothetical protein
VTSERYYATGLLLAGALLAGCADAGASSASSPGIPNGEIPTEITAGVAPLPAPVGDVVLTIRGDVTQPNDVDSVRTDLAGLEGLGVVSATVHEPFLGEDVDVAGVPVATLLAAAGVAPDAPTTWTALDDYQVRFVAGDLAAEGALLATRVDGRAIAIEDGGPIRILFPDDDGPIGRDSNQWIWSIAHIEVG